MQAWKAGTLDQIRGGPLGLSGPRLALRTLNRTRQAAARSGWALVKVSVGWTLTARVPPGKSYTMIGKDSSPQSLGVVPCAISWLFRLIDERKEKTGTRFSVRVSAVEVCGRDQSLRDLLAEVASGSFQDAPSPGVYLREDPVCGAQVHHTTATQRGEQGLAVLGGCEGGLGKAGSGVAAQPGATKVLSLHPSPAPEPERAAGAHSREGGLLPGRCPRSPRCQPGWLQRGRPAQFAHALHAARLPVPHGEVRPGRE